MPFNLFKIRLQYTICQLWSKPLKLQRVYGKVFIRVHNRPTLINAVSIPKCLKQSRNIDKTTAFSK